jgi:hypothetical protein
MNLLHNSSALSQTLGNFILLNMLQLAQTHFCRLDQQLVEVPVQLSARSAWSLQKEKIAVPFALLDISVEKVQPNQRSAQLDLIAKKDRLNQLFVQLETTALQDQLTQLLVLLEPLIQ